MRTTIRVGWFWLTVLASGAREHPDNKNIVDKLTQRRNRIVRIMKDYDELFAIEYWRDAPGAMVISRKHRRICVL